MVLLLSVEILLGLSLASGQYWSIAKQPLNDYDNLDYFWREYDGTIPSDAVISPDDPDGFYIGQAMSWAHGTVFVPIYPGKREFVVSYAKQIEIVSKGIMILCSPHPENFSWKSTNGANFTIDMLPFHPIIAGAEDEESVVYVAKVNKAKGTLVGKIRQHVILNRKYPGLYKMQTRMSAVDESEKKVKFYRKFNILIYEDSQILSRSSLRGVGKELLLQGISKEQLM